MARSVENVLTNKGRALIAKSLAAGTPIVFSRAEIGTGLAGDLDNLAAKTSLIAKYAEAAIQKRTADNSGNFVITLSYENSGVKTSVYIEEIGIYARLSTEAGSAAILFSYLTFGQYPTIILPETVQGMQRIFDIPFSFGSGDSVSVNITPSGMVSSGDVSETSSPGKIVKVGTDGKLHVDISGDASTLDGHNSAYFAKANHVHDAATQTKNGFMSSSDKKKLDEVGSKIDQDMKTTSSPTFAGLTVNGVISGARFV